MGKSLRKARKSFFRIGVILAKDWGNTASVVAGMAIVAPVMYKLGQDSTKEEPSDWSSLFKSGGLWTLGLGAAAGTIGVAGHFNYKWKSSEKSLQRNIGRLEGNNGDLLNKLQRTHPFEALRFRDGNR